MLVEVISRSNHTNTILRSVFNDVTRKSIHLLVSIQYLMSISYVVSISVGNISRVGNILCLIICWCLVYLSLGLYNKWISLTSISVYILFHVLVSHIVLSNHIVSYNLSVVMSITIRTIIISNQTIFGNIISNITLVRSSFISVHSLGLVIVSAFIGISSVYIMLISLSFVISIFIFVNNNIAGYYPMLCSINC